MRPICRRLNNTVLLGAKIGHTVTHIVNAVFDLKVLFFLVMPSSSQNNSNEQSFMCCTCSRLKVTPPPPPRITFASYVRQHGHILQYVLTSDESAC